MHSFRTDMVDLQMSLNDFEHGSDCDSSTEPRIQSKAIYDKVAMKDREKSTHLNLKGVTMDTHPSVYHARAISDQKGGKHIKSIRQTQVQNKLYACLDIHPFL